MNMLTNIATAGAFVVAASVASASTIDFESVSPTDFGSPVLNADGFDWDFSASGWFIGNPDDAFYPDGTTNGTNILAASGDSGGTARVTMTQNGGGTFDIVSLFAASSNNTLTNSIEITGMLSGGGTVSTTLDVGGSFAEYMLAGFTNLLSVDFVSVNSGGYNQAGFALDDFELSAAVPVPAALPLLLLGLGGLGVAGRRRRNAG